MTAAGAGAEVRGPEEQGAELCGLDSPALWCLAVLAILGDCLTLEHVTQGSVQSGLEHFALQPK